VTEYVAARRSVFPMANVFVIQTFWSPEWGQLKKTVSQGVITLNLSNISVSPKTSHWTNVWCQLHDRSTSCFCRMRRTDEQKGRYLLHV